ncbi:hypothetical protein BpHYR1_041900 [Brachionus plicatilis]|uniref:Uncharacterized protein n=1 Tax=Brachionus plicatilis TaxID=10195 RepID=A0A3M7S1W3_BRAPC|nr:hypothetical protein BpHYR1_041900 [Brachionus plicatilis]
MAEGSQWWASKIFMINGMPESVRNACRLFADDKTPQVPFTMKIDASHRHVFEQSSVERD